MKKVMVWTALAGVCFCVNSFAADANLQLAQLTSGDVVKSPSIIGSKPKPIEWLTTGEQHSIAGAKPRPPKWLLKDEAVSIIGPRPKPPEW